MKTLLRASAWLCGASLLAVSAAHAAQAPRFVAESARTVAGGRAIEVVVGQAEIRSSIKSIISSTGGMVGGLLGANIDAERGKKAEAEITPLRDQLIDFNTDDLALATTKNGLATVDWLQSGAIKFSKDATTHGKSTFLDAMDAQQAAFFIYTYDLAPDFSSLRVTISLQFANKALPENSSNPDARLSLNHLAYSQSITSVVVLPNAGSDIDANAQLWAADNGKLARGALTHAFANAEKLIPRTLALTDADIKAMKSGDKPREAHGGYEGRVQDSSPGHTLMWADGFIQVDSEPQNQ